MRGDYTRFTFDPRKRFTSVLLQQGRVQLDSDWNELAAITAHLEQTETIDVIGVCGAPEAGGGFAIEPIDGNADFRITNGRIYVGGLLCELLPEELPIADFPSANKIELPAVVLDGRPIAADDWLELAADGETPQLFRVSNVSETTVTLTKSPGAAFGDLQKNPTVSRALTYRTQPDLPTLLEPDEGRTDLVYLDVWQRHVTAVEDPRLREEALLGPDTATRIQTVCQVRIAPDRATCDDLDDLVPEQSGGRLTTRARPGSDAENLCIVPPGGGYNALENRLYRVEIHDGGDIGNATYKWSRYNGAVAYPVARFDGTLTDRIWLRGLGDDDVLRLKRGDWVEVMDDETELAGEVGKLVYVDGIDDGERSIKVIPPIAADTFTVERHARVRRWDEDVPTNGSVETIEEWTGLENGVEIRFTGEDFKPGDYWAFAARTNTGQVDVLTERHPLNVEHRICPLAILEWSDTGTLSATRLHDCRPPFVSLVDLLSQRVLRYVAGDGQEGRPGELLPDQLVVGVEDGLGRPVKGHEVIFATEGGGTLEPGPMTPLNLLTDSDGLAACRWQLGPDPDKPSAVRAELKTTPSPQAKSLPVIFHATSYYLSLRYLSGDGQHGRPGEVLSAPLIVGVEDAGGRPVRRAELTFTAEAGGSVGAVGSDPASSTFTVRTDSAGVAQAAWKLGADPDGEHRVLVALTGLGPPASVGQDRALGITFAATAHYLSLRYIGGDGQAGRADHTLPAPLVVGVEDSDGRPVPGISVVFDADGGGELIDMAASTSAPSLTDETGNDGTVGVVWKLGEDPDDEQKVTASLEGIGPAAGAQDAALELVFRARPQYLSLRYITGDGREGRPGEILSDPPLAVGVEDGDGRPVADIPVIFTPSGGASVRKPGDALSDQPITIATDDSGQARCDLQLGDTDGVYTATATLDPALEQEDSLPIVFRSVAETNVEHDRLPEVAEINWTNDSPLLLTTLNAGLAVRFSEPMSPVSLSKRDLFVVTVELAESDVAGVHVGLRSHIINGTLTPGANNELWTFVPQPQVSLAALTRWRTESAKLGMEDPRLRVVLKAHGIFSQRGPYLNGDVLWTVGETAGVLSKPARLGDPHEGGDFESWAFLRPPPPRTRRPITLRPFTEGPEFTLRPNITIRPVTLRPPPVFVSRLPDFEPMFIAGPVPRFEGVVPLAGVDIADEGGDSLVHVGNETARPTVAAADAPTALVLTLGANLPDDQAVGFVESLQLVDADGTVASGTPEWLGNNQVRIPIEGELAAGDYLLVPRGAMEASPTFGFRVS